MHRDDCLELAEKIIEQVQEEFENNYDWTEDNLTVNTKWRLKEKIADLITETQQTNSKQRVRVAGMGALGWQNGHNDDEDEGNYEPLRCRVCGTTNVDDQGYCLNSGCKG